MTEATDKSKKEHHHHHHHHHHHKDDDEIEIDLSADVPLSKKELRLVKKGKISREKLEKRKQKRVGTVAEPKVATDKEESTPGLVNNSKRSKFGVWIGNLSFETTREDLVAFIVAKTEQAEQDPEKNTEKVSEEDIVRINMPSRGRQNKGFAYVDFQTADQQSAVIALSESFLNGRNLLIKKSDSYEGRPAFPVSRNPPSRILFVGNLSFDTVEDELRNNFMHCGEITRVRMATFEDTGKCKGFAFLDFVDEEGPTKALKDTSCHKMAGRPLRMEFGEDRSKRKVRSQEGREPRVPKETNPEPKQPERQEFRVPRQQHESSYKRLRNTEYAPNKRLKSSIALATAQRENPGVKPQGKKVKF